MTLLDRNAPDPALACVLRGDWVAYCPRPDCNNAEYLPNPNERIQIHRARYPNNRSTHDCFECTYCHMIAPIIWPPDPEQLTMPLAIRPVPRTRNWFPTGHPVAAQGFETGQTALDLWLENADHGLSD